MVKLHLISTISAWGAIFITIDLKDFYLNMPLNMSEYARLEIKYILTKFMDEYA